MRLNCQALTVTGLNKKVIRSKTEEGDPYNRTDTDFFDPSLTNSKSLTTLSSPMLSDSPTSGNATKPSVSKFFIHPRSKKFTTCNHNMYISVFYIHKLKLLLKSPKPTNSSGDPSKSSIKRRETFQT